jgi:hypothetical protein
MPKELHDKLKREAEEKFPGDKERQDRYVYGTLQRIEQGQRREHWYFRKVGKVKAQ